MVSTRIVEIDRDLDQAAVDTDVAAERRTRLDLQRADLARGRGERPDPLADRGVAQELLVTCPPLMPT